MTALEAEQCLFLVGDGGAPARWSAVVITAFSIAVIRYEEIFVVSLFRAISECDATFRNDIYSRSFDGSQHNVSARIPRLTPTKHNQERRHSPSETEDSEHI